MKFLVDQAISWQVARELAAAGHDAVHVRDIGLSAAGDAEILARAAAEGRTVVTQDTDFGTLLAASGTKRPSVVLLRMRDGRPGTHSQALLATVKAIEEELRTGAIVVISEDQMRIRRLPVR